MNFIKRYLKKRRLLKLWKKEADSYERGNSPYSNYYDLYVWKAEAYKRGIGRLNGERQGKYLFETSLQDVRDEWNPKFMLTEEKEYRDYLNQYICDNVVPIINSVFEDDSLWKKREKDLVVETLTEYSKDGELSVDQYMDKLDQFGFLAGDYMTFKQWKRQKSLDKLLNKGIEDE